MPVSNSDPKALWSAKGQEESPVGPGEYENLPKSYAPQYSIQVELRTRLSLVDTV